MTYVAAKAATFSQTEDIFVKSLIMTISIVFYIFVGLEVFVQCTIETLHKCPGSGMMHSALSGIGWPIVLGYKITGSESNENWECLRNKK